MPELYCCECGIVVIKDGRGMGYRGAYVLCNECMKKDIGMSDGIMMQEAFNWAKLFLIEAEKKEK